MIPGLLGARPPTLPIGYSTILPLILMISLLVLRWFFIRKAVSRRLLLVGLGFAALVFAAVLMVPEAWLRLTLMGFGFLAFAGIFLYQWRTGQREDSTSLLLLGSMAILGLAAILFGVPRLNISAAWQRFLRYLVLTLVALGFGFSAWLKGDSSHAESEVAPPDDRRRP